ncbi:MAG: FG-GAP repeat domain-containing protein [Gemmatimonadales bacterium]
MARQTRWRVPSIRATPMRTPAMRLIRMLLPVVVTAGAVGAVWETLADGFAPAQAWTSDPYYGARGTFFADLTGDRRADAVVVNDAGITVRRSNGGGFGPNETWSGPFFGTRGTFFADATGDRLADAIVVNDAGMTLRRSTGSGFGPNESWSAAFAAVAFADVTGDGRADAIAVNSRGLLVRVSTGAGFGPEQAWHSQFYGDYGTFFADLNGDGRADAIAVGAGGIRVLLSTGTAFGGPAGATSWSSPFVGDRGTYFADVTGDGQADAIAVFTNTAVLVRRATTAGRSSGFGADEDWSRFPFWGSRATAFADVDGNGVADAIAVGDAGIAVRLAGATVASRTAVRSQLTLSKSTSPPASGTYQVGLIGFIANRATWDNALQVDGKGDEVYASTDVKVLALNGTAVPAGLDVSLQSYVYGDVNGQTAAIRKQGGQASPLGGFGNGSSYPNPSYVAYPIQLGDPRTIPMLLWSGTLIRGENAVVVTPTLWEYDGSAVAGAFTGWVRWAQQTATGVLANTQTARQYISLPNIPELDLASLGAGVALAFQEGVLGTDGDRPIGMKLESGRAVFRPRTVVLTYDGVEQLLANQMGSWPRGTILIGYQDDPKWWGDYTLILRVERVP